MKQLRALVHNDLNKIEKILSAQIDNSNPISECINIFLQEKSKRIRSVLCLLYLKSYGIEINDSILSILSAGELIHNASLLHDDVIDNSELRRNEITVAKKYSSQISILSGDYLLCFAVKILMKVNNPSILDIFLDATKNMCESEFKQYSNRGKNISVEKYLSIIEGKTASLFEAILYSTAIISGLDKDNAKMIGKLFGIIFQINNDMQPESIKNDKLNGVKTAIDILGIENTRILKDNYKKEMRDKIKNLPDNEYKQGLEDLTDKL